MCRRILSGDFGLQRIVTAANWDIGHTNAQVLDIFGFENFEVNSFEQLCINVANEQLQQYFNQHIFAYELAELEAEGLKASNITFVDNAETLDLFLQRQGGAPY